MIKDEFSVLFARIDDLCRRAERGEVGVSGFLSPREQHFILKYLKERGYSCTCFMYGGYDSAERKRAFILPEFIELPSVYGDISEFLDADPLCALFIAGSGYRNLSYRDYLGSVLGLGIDRSVVGDIIVSDSDGGAFTFCDTSISDFILTELKKVASDTVKVPITFSKNPGVFAGQYYFEYDASALEYVGYEEGDLFEEYGANAKDGVVNFVINAKDLKDVTKNGTLVTLEFKIKADAKPGDYAITLGKETLICNLDEQTVSPEIKEGKITVK
jgi:hypothetical protein